MVSASCIFSIVAIAETKSPLCSRPGIVYFHLGFFQAAAEEGSIAQSLDPLNPGHSADRIFQYFHNQKFDLALKEEENSPPGNRSVFRPLLLSYLGRHKEALESIQPFLAIQVASSEGLRDDPAIVRSAYAILLARSGDFLKAEENIDRAIQNDLGFSHFHHAEYNIAVAYAILGKVDMAVEWLQKTADHGFPCYPSFENDPYFRELLSHPPYVEFLAKLKQQSEESRARLQL